MSSLIASSTYVQMRWFPNRSEPPRWSSRTTVFCQIHQPEFHRVLVRRSDLSPNTGLKLILGRWWCWKYDLQTAILPVQAQTSHLHNQQLMFPDRLQKEYCINYDSNFLNTYNSLRKNYVGLHLPICQSSS